MGWANHIWFWVWVVTGLVDLQALLHPQHQDMFFNTSLAGSPYAVSIKQQSILSSCPQG